MEDVKVEDDDEDDDDLFKSARGLEPRGLEPEPAKVRVFSVAFIFTAHRITCQVKSFVCVFASIRLSVHYCTS